MAVPGSNQPDPGPPGGRCALLLRSRLLRRRSGTGRSIGSGTGCIGSRASSSVGSTGSSVGSTRCRISSSTSGLGGSITGSFDGLTSRLHRLTGGIRRLVHRLGSLLGAAGLATATATDQHEKCSTEHRQQLRNPHDSPLLGEKTLLI